MFWSGKLSYSVTKERRKFPEFGDAALHVFRSPNKATRLTKQDVALLKTKWHAKAPSGEHRNIIGNLENIMHLITALYIQVPKSNAASYDVLSCGNVLKLWLILRVALNEAATVKQPRKVPTQPEQVSASFKGNH